ncbi:hypothetical protein BDFB_009439 [Asbolus verrucosus]|uniref:Uncharacterized protein n=1 Tax=Asbolus verrucosus TaxID=1661398 RepID=A0A482VLE8_ASBVE|nr:hypothetical protein BDFB_009439 [Asbolus verrucosus]
MFENQKSWKRLEPYLEV